MSRLNETLVLILIPVLLLLSLVISSTSIRSPVTLTPSSEAVPEWFENCVIHWMYDAHFEDVLIDRLPYTIFAGCSKDERVLRCGDDAIRELAFPDTADGGFGVSPSDASPAVLGTIKSLVAKGHVKPFSRFEVFARVLGNWSIIPPPHPPAIWLWTGPTLAVHKYLEFKDAMEGNCTDIVTKKCYEDYVSCDQHSFEYWCHFFPIQHQTYP